MNDGTRPDDGDEDPRGSVAFTVELVIAGLLVFAAAIAIGSLTGAESGTVADWVAAFSTLAAFLAAVIAGRYAAQAVGIERRRDRQRDADQRREHAALVAAWLEPGLQFVAANITRSVITASAGTATPNSGGYLPEGLRVSIRNLSYLPVELCRVHLYARPGNDPEFEPIYFATWGAGTLVPHEKRTEDIDSPWVGNRLYGVTVGNRLVEDGLTVLVGWSFRDAEGRNWLKAPSHELSQVAYSEVPRPVDWAAPGRPGK